MPNGLCSSFRKFCLVFLYISSGAVVIGIMSNTLIRLALNQFLGSFQPGNLNFLLIRTILSSFQLINLQYFNKSMLVTVGLIIGLASFLKVDMTFAVLNRSVLGGFYKAEFVSSSFAHKSGDIKVVER